ncbi:MAG: DUF1080 domain-containing protein [Bacteroidia bacterium]|nr:DUF1080 domain-containing protein [Bacteroidia bacterium]
MKINRILLIVISLLVVSFYSFSQDKRTLETKVADLLARFPANDIQMNDRMMADMLSLGEQGIKLICDNIVPAGTGNDTPQRFAIESMSRFLSQKGKETERLMWEGLCISYVAAKSDNGIKDFFMKQLQVFGGPRSAEAMKIYLTNKDLCEPAVAVIIKSDPASAESIFSDALKNQQLPCAASVMNHLAAMGSQKAVKEYVLWASSSDVNIKASAYYALAMSGSPEANAVLSGAAKAASYKWEPSGSVEALLKYAEIIGKKGNIKASDKICKLIMSECDENDNIHYKTLALGTYVSMHGIESMKLLQTAAAHPDKTYRNAAMKMSLSIPGNEAVKNWISYYPKATVEARPELITLFGKSGDQASLPLVTASLDDADQAVRTEAAAALVRLSGKNAIPSLVTYMMKSSDASDQEAAKSALMTVLNNESIPDLLIVLKDGGADAKKSAIELLAWNGDNQYFPLVVQYVSSPDKKVQFAAVHALQSLAGQNDQGHLIELLNSAAEPVIISELQLALSAAALKNPVTEKRSDLLLKAIAESGNSYGLKIKIIPVLAKTGGMEALQLVTREFGGGNPEMKTACFNSLISWNDYTASSSLYEICKSGNTDYEDPAFDGYLRQIRGANISDDQKLLLLRKIMPLAKSPDKQKKLFSETGRIRTYPALFFTGKYLDDPAVSAEAARAAMSIALPASGSSTGMYGTIVKEILVKSAAKLKGAESDYEKEQINKYLASMPAEEGFVPMFNGKDLSGWQGLVENPVTRARMKPAELSKKQAAADKKVPLNWSVRDGMIWFTGNGENLCSVKEYGDFEMYVDWLISKEGDSGIYLRGSPQVQIWDPSRVDVGAQVGSGGLYNNQKNPSKPLKFADNPVGEWNTFRILMTGEKVSVWLNGELVVDNVTLENYWDRNIPIFPKGAIELQAHGTDLAFRDIYVREISDKEYNLTAEEKAEGFVSLVNGKEANNGLGIRAPLSGDAAYSGMELQILDDTPPVYANAEP